MKDENVMIENYRKKLNEQGIADISIASVLRLWSEGNYEKMAAHAQGVMEDATRIEPGRYRMADGGTAIITEVADVDERGGPVAYGRVQPDGCIAWYPTCWWTRGRDRGRVYESSFYKKHENLRLMGRLA